MKREDYDGREQRQICIAMIVNRQVLAKVSSAWKEEGLFSSPPLNLIGRLCVYYFRKHNDAPKKHIEILLLNHAKKKNFNKDIMEPIEELLQSLSGEYEQANESINPDYLLDIAQKEFEAIGRKKFLTSYRDAVDLGDAEAADNLMRSYRRIELGGDTGVFAEDLEAFKAAFEAKKEPLIKCPEGLGDFIGNQLSKDAFVSFAGPSKRGKSFQLLNMAWYGMTNRKRIAFFETGDMTQNQLFMRIATRAAKKPELKGIYQLPTNIVWKSGHPFVSFEEKVYDNNLSPIEAHQAYVKYLERVAKSKGELLWICCKPSGALSVEDIKILIETKTQQNNWVPDIIIIDYADLLKPPKNASKDFRHQIDATWRELRALSQERHCLVLTATQTNRESSLADVIRMDHSSEDKRKVDHVTGMIGINVNAEDKKQQITRLNWMALRDKEFHTNRCVYCAGAVWMSNPSVKSIYP
jgi:hypothetical protein